MTDKLYTQSDMEALRERCAKVALSVEDQYRKLSIQFREEYRTLQKRYSGYRGLADEDAEALHLKESKWRIETADAQLRAAAQIADTLLTLPLPLHPEGEKP